MVPLDEAKSSWGVSAASAARTLRATPRFLLIRPYCVATEARERTTADPSLRYASFRMTASGDAILSGRINFDPAL
jgi:hypothetical protein